MTVADYLASFGEHVWVLISLACFLISRAHSSRCGSQNKSMKKEESSVLKGNVPDKLLFKYISSLFAVQLRL